MEPDERLGPVLTNVFIHTIWWNLNILRDGLRAGYFRLPPLFLAVNAGMLLAAMGALLKGEGQCVVGRPEGETGRIIKTSLPPLFL